MTRNNDKDRPYLFITLGTLVLIGGGIIALIYGLDALFMALPILLSGALMITLLWMLVTAVSRWRERSEREYHSTAARYLSSNITEEDK